MEAGFKGGGYELCLENIFISYSFKILFSVCVVYHPRTNIVPLKNTAPEWEAAA